MSTTMKTLIKIIILGHSLMDVSSKNCFAAFPEFSKETSLHHNQVICATNGRISSILHSQRKRSHIDASEIFRIRGGSAADAFINPKKFVGANKARCWTLLLVVIITDTLSTTLMKMAQEESSLQKLMAAYAGYALSLAGFGICLSGIDVGIAYAVWAALGTAIVSVAGIILFNENCNPFKVTCILMIVAGVVGLNLSENH